VSALRLTVGWLAAAVGGRIVSGDPEQVVGRITTDSRSLQAGDFCVALRGSRFDGHAFVDEAIGRGAVGAIVQAGLKAGPTKPRSGHVEVGDTTIALQDWARGGKRRPRRSWPPGSAGKTTTKETMADFCPRRSAS
jgi:UDP-N-acetylmuramyl pentapeptide synthase